MIALATYSTNKNARKLPHGTGLRGSYGKKAPRWRRNANNQIQVMMLPSHKLLMTPANHGLTLTLSMAANTPEREEHSGAHQSQRGFHIAPAGIDRHGDRRPHDESQRPSDAGWRISAPFAARGVVLIVPQSPQAEGRGRTLENHLPLAGPFRRKVRAMLFEKTSQRGHKNFTG